MAEWYYQKDGQEQGPVDTATLKQMAVDGQLDPSDLIWREGMAQWAKASKAKGLFPSQAQSASPPSPPPAPPPEAVADADPPPLPEEPVEALPISYASPISHLSSSSLPARVPAHKGLLIALTSVAGLMLILNVLLIYKSYFGNKTHANNEDIFMVLGAVGAFLLLSIPALVCWLILINGTHTYLRDITGGQYGISPSKAVGFSFIPVFDGFWIIYMPWRACAELNRHLAMQSRPPISAGMVMGCQIGSVLTALFVPGLTPVLYAASMWQIQGGMKRLTQA